MRKEHIKLLRRWRNDPLLFVRQAFKAEPDVWQREVLEAYQRGDNRIAMQACVGPGKTCTLAWILWHFMLTRKNAQAAVTSVSEDNLRDGLWKELAYWHSLCPVLQAAFEVRSTRIYAKDHEKLWFISFRTWAKQASSDQMSNTLRGLHAQNIMFVIDEAGGVPDPVAFTAEAVLAEEREDKDARLIIAGNPTNLAGPLYRAATKETHLWTRFEITGDPDDPNRASRVSKEWAQQAIDSFGRDNPWVIVNVFGKFPAGKFNALISLDAAREAERRVVPANWYSSEPKIVGIDVARQGSDRSVIFPRQGRVAFQPITHRIPNIDNLAGHVARALDKWQPHAIFVDGAGFGFALVDRLRSLGYDAVGVDGGKNPEDGRRYYNKRAEMWGTMAEWINNGGAIPTVQGLVNELTAVEYHFENPKGLLQMQAKKQVVLEQGFSPDLADALAFTFAYKVNKLASQNATSCGKALTDYNHLEMTG